MALSNRVFPIMADTAVSTLKTPGHVYFVQAECGGLIKIGWATKPVTRLGALQSHCPVKLTCLLVVVGDGRMERALHLLFAADRRHGEWFEPSPALLELIEEWRVTPPPAPVWQERKPHQVAVYVPSPDRKPPKPQRPEPEWDEESAAEVAKALEW